MPIYAYRCEACGHALEVLRKISDPALTECPSCHAQTLRKQLTAAGFQLKGSGWYVTDFKGGGGKPAAGAEAPAAAPAASESGGEAKPAAPAAAPSSGPTSSSGTSSSGGCGSGCACH